MKLLVITLLLGLSAMAQPVTTPVVGPVYSQFSTVYTGTVKITLNSQGAASSGNQVLSVPNTVQITAGNFVSTSTACTTPNAICLIPNDTMPGTVYVFTFGNGLVKYCTFPTSSSPLSVANAAYCTNTNPNTVAGPSIPLSWLSGTGYSNGTYCIQVAGGVVSLSTSGCPGSGGGGGNTWGNVSGTWGSNSLTW